MPEPPEGPVAAPADREKAAFDPAAADPVRHSVIGGLRSRHAVRGGDADDARPRRQPDAGTYAAHFRRQPLREQKLQRACSGAEHRLHPRQFRDAAGAENT